MKTQFLSCLCAVLLLTSISINATEASEPSSWARQYVQSIKENNRYTDGLLFHDYQGEITRLEFAYAGVKVYEELTGETCLPGDAAFDDTENPWVLKAKNHGIVNGNGTGSYNPEAFITREQMAVLFMNVLKAANVTYQPPGDQVFNDEADFSSWALEAIYTAKANGLVGGVGDNFYNPKGTASREQAIIMITRVLDGFKVSASEAPDLYTYFDKNKNNLIINDGEDAYILRLTPDAMVYHHEDTIKVRMAKIGNLDLSMHKYDPVSRALLEVDVKVYDDADDLMPMEDGLYVYDASKTKESTVSVNVRDDFGNTTKSNQSELETRIEPKFTLDFGGSQSLKLHYVAPSFSFKRSYEFMKLDPELLLGCQVLTAQDKSMPDRYTAILSDGQYAEVYDKEAILYKLDGSIKPQYVGRFMEEAPAVTMIQLPEPGYEDVLDHFFIFRKNDDESKIATLSMSHESFMDLGITEIPSMEHLGYDVFEYHISVGKALNSELVNVELP